jgi:hypothetical protein
MRTYWEVFVEDFPWVKDLPLIKVLELFWHFCHEPDDEVWELMERTRLEMSKQIEPSA